MARSMLSLGMLFALASATAARRRGFPPTSPPPRRAATVISLRMRVKILPRFASAAPFLCLMVLHLLWPDMRGCSFELERQRAVEYSMSGSRAAGRGRAARVPRPATRDLLSEPHRQSHLAQQVMGAIDGVHHP